MPINTKIIKRSPLAHHYVKRLKMSDHWLEKAMVAALIELCHWQPNDATTK